MKSFLPALLGLILFSLTSCKTQRVVHTAKDEQMTSSEVRVIHDVALNGKIYSAMWQQNAGEFRALCYQAYNAARMSLDLELQKAHTRPLAIITDVDETFLDNSPYAVTQAQRGNEFDLESWMDWTSKGSALPLAGSNEFFNYAASKGVSIFYITNRDIREKEGTLKNLINLEFPFADEEHLMLLTDTSNKEARRRKILENYEVIMYLGDNLGDFAEVFYKQPQAVRNQKVNELSKLFGVRFIVLPNSGYGDWETSLPTFNPKASPSEKDKAIMHNLRGY
ncbi:MAG: 5'-nucleotidase, lipoprotein e(P4) family [Saprospiraceae bacterium]|nr:MAG: 5'-nucleotidase [Bacteroidetes bacterium OLB9]MCO6464404.1 5'-nucleotidase, lipoprotein e(P4) family [Saprospiraceae bacterium]MCZ2340069.1 5'-nucleotidase, lipoprotein e(P4) family [Chitinophagales bacterium]